MEKIQQEVYKSGKHTFLTEEECLAYEKRNTDDVYRSEIITFLIGANFKQLNSEKAVKLFWKDPFFTKWEMLFISDKIYIYKKNNEFVKKPEESFSVNLTNIDAFKTLFFDLLKIQ